MTENTKPTFDELLQAAKDEKWDFVDQHLKDEDLTDENIEWAARVGLIDADDNVADLAASVLMVSNKNLGVFYEAAARAWMEDHEYNIVRYRLAMALYKRGDRYPETLAVMNEATADKDVGELAQEFLKAA
jgi:hypothetical protein